MKFDWKLRKWLRKCENFVGNSIFRMLPNTRNRFSDYFSLQNQTPEFYFPYGNSFTLAFILHSEFDLHRTKCSLTTILIYMTYLDTKRQITSFQQYFLHQVSTISFCLRESCLYHYYQFLAPNINLRRLRIAALLLD